MFSVLGRLLLLNNSEKRDILSVFGLMIEKIYQMLVLVRPSYGNCSQCSVTDSIKHIFQLTSTVKSYQLLHT